MPMSEAVVQVRGIGPGSGRESRTSIIPMLPKVTSSGSAPAACATSMISRTASTDASRGPQLDVVEVDLVEHQRDHRGDLQVEHRVHVRRERSEHPMIELGGRWASAEQNEDADALDALVVDDFRLVGPLGFALDKRQWLDRYRNRDLETRSLVWDEVEVWQYGDTAVAIGRHRLPRAAQRQTVPGDACGGPDGSRLAAGRSAPQPDRTAT